jgi:hypothetical protein
MRTFLLMLAMCLFASVASAQIGGYDPLTTEQPDDIDTDWVQSTHTESCFVSPWGSVTGGIAYKSIAPGRGNWANDADFGDSTTWTVDIRTLCATSGSGWQYQEFTRVDDGDEIFYLAIGDLDGSNNTGVGFMAEDGGPPGSYGFYYGQTTTDDYHVYRFVRDGLVLKLYIDDGANPVSTAIAPNMNYNTTSQVRIGRTDGRAAGKNYTDYWWWDDSNAISAPPIPEPATLTLLALGGDLLLRRKK